MTLPQILRISLLSASLLTGHFAWAQEGTPLPVPNGGFEDGVRGWTIREKVPMSAPDAAAAHEGKMGLRVRDEDATAGSSALSDRIPVTPGGVYRLKFWAKTASNSAAVVQFRYYNADRKGVEAVAAKLPVASTGDRWMEMSLRDRPPREAAFLAIWIHTYTGAKATLDFDDFTLAQTSVAELPGTAAAPAAAQESPKTAQETVRPQAGAIARLSPPYIIIKADDLRQVNGRPHARWKKFADFIKARKVKAGIGVITNSLEGDHPAYINWIKEQQATGLFEFWNHGHVHEPWEENGQTVQEYKGTSYEVQKEHFQKSQALAREKLGFPFTAFGAPGNAADANTARVLSEDPDIKVWIYGDGKNPAGKTVLSRIYPVNIENPLFVPSLEKFIEGYNKYPQREYFVIQGHAAKWDDARFEQFTKIVDFLIEQKAVFVTPTEYAKIIASKP